jgi:anti-sigma-K factor RskA
LIVDDQPVSVGTFEPDTSGVAELLVTVNPSRVAVTQEPDGGSDQPTTPVLISASLV